MTAFSIERQLLRLLNSIQTTLNSCSLGMIEGSGKASHRPLSKPSSAHAFFSAPMNLVNRIISRLLFSTYHNRNWASFHDVNTVTTTENQYLAGVWCGIIKELSIDVGVIASLIPFIGLWCFVNSFIYTWIIDFTFDFTYFKYGKKKNRACISMPPSYRKALIFTGKNQSRKTG